MDGALPVIHTAYIPVLIYTPVVLARERGYYRATGLDVHLDRLQTGGNIVPRLLAGDLDIAIGGPGPDFWQAIASGHDLRLLAPLHAERPPATTPLIVRAEPFDRGEIETVADLRGRTVSSPSAGVPLFWLASALESGGLTLADVDLRIVPYEEVGAALASGEVDAALLGEPLVTDLVERGIAARLASDFVDGLQPTYVYTGRELLDARREDVTRFLIAYLRACSDLQSTDRRRGWGSPATVRVISRFTDMPGAEVEESMHPHYEPEAAFHEGSLERLYEFFISRGAIEPIPNFKPASLIDSGPARDALQRLRAEG